MVIATLREVATRAEVSVGTASAAFSGAQYVSPTRRAAVLRAALLLGYQPPATLARKASCVLVLSHQPDGETLAADPFYGEMLAGIESGLASHGTAAIVHRTLGDRTTDTERPARLRAIVLLGVCPDGLLRARCRGWVRRLRVVAIDESLADCGVDSVITDDGTAMIGVVERLVAMGHTRFVVFRGPQAFSSFRLRCGGVQEGLRRTAIPGRHSLVIDAPATVNGGRQGMRQALRTWRGARLAVLTANDAQAAGVVAEVRDNSLRVPDDISVVGFDDTPDAATSTPALSTVRVPRHLMGEIAAHLALRPRVGTDEEAAVTVGVAPLFVQRRST